MGDTLYGVDKRVRVDPKLIDWSGCFYLGGCGSSLSGNDFQSLVQCFSTEFESHMSARSARKPTRAGIACADLERVKAQGNKKDANGEKKGCRCVTCQEKVNKKIKN